MERMREEAIWVFLEEAIHKQWRRDKKKRY